MYSKYQTCWKNVIPLDIEEPWDNRCGGVRLVNKNFDMTKHKYQPGVVPVKYDIFYTDDPKQFGTFALKKQNKNVLAY